MIHRERKIIYPIVEFHPTVEKIYLSAVVGFDNTAFAGHSRIMLTTVSQRKYEMGAIGVTILIESIEQQKTDYQHHAVLEPKLIIRESSGHKLKSKHR